MQIETAHSIGDKVRHRENGICTVVEIDISVSSKREVTTSYECHHNRYDGDGDYAGTYYEHELSVLTAADLAAIRRTAP